MVNYLVQVLGTLTFENFYQWTDGYLAQQAGDRQVDVEVRGLLHNIYIYIYIYHIMYECIIYKYIYNV